MVDPVITPLVVAGVSWVAGNLLTNEAGVSLITNMATSQVFDPLCGRLRRAVAGRIRAADGSLPKNHDIERAVRTAQMQATRVIIGDFAERAERGNRQVDIVFSKVAARWVEREIKAIPQLKISDPVLNGLVAALDASFVEDVGLEAQARLAAEATFVELEAGAGGHAPTMFKTLFLEDRDGSRWFEAFGDFLAEQIKDNENFRSILTAARLAEIAAGVRRVEDLLAEREPIWTALREKADRLLAQSDRMEGTLGEVKEDTSLLNRKMDQLLTMHGANANERAALKLQIEHLLADKALKDRAIENFLTEIGELPLTPDLWPERLEIFARRYHALLAKLARSTELTDDLEVEHQRALSAVEQGDLGSAESILAEISNHITSRRVGLEEQLHYEARNEATIFGQRGDLANARLDYRAAADLYGRAASSEPLNERRLRLHWVICQGQALQRQGEEFGDTDALRAAIKIYRETALPLTDRTQAPADWAVVQEGIGTALCNLGRREPANSIIEESIAAFREALSVRDRNIAELEWATTQNDLAISLSILGKRTSKIGHLLESSISFNLSLEFRRLNHPPIDAASTYLNLGNNQKFLYLITQDTQYCLASIFSYRSAARIFKKLGKRSSWGLSQCAQGLAMHTIWTHRGRSKFLSQACRLQRIGLESIDKTRWPVDWVTAMRNYALCVRDMGTTFGKIELIFDSINILEQSISIQNASYSPLDSANCMANMAISYEILFDNVNEATHLELALNFSSQALEAVEKLGAGEAVLPFRELNLRLREKVDAFSPAPASAGTPGPDTARPRS